MISGQAEARNVFKAYTLAWMNNSKYGESFIPLSLNYDTLMYGLHGGPEWPGGSYDLINNQIIIPTNHYPWVIRTYYTCCKKNKPSALRKAQQSIINLKHFEAHSLYKSKCSSCHRKNKNGNPIEKNNPKGDIISNDQLEVPRKTK